MNIIITGSSGFLGTALCVRLEAEGHKLTKLNSRNCDLRTRESLNQFAADKYDVVYHLAAWTQAGDFCLKNPGLQWIFNQQINTHVLDWWHAAQPQAKLVFMGTSCAYDPALPLIEDNYMAGEPIESLYTYAMTKRMLYQGARALHSQFGLNYLCAVPSTLYGPGYHTDGRQMHFIFDLIRKIIRGKEFGERVVLWGDGHQRRELVYVDDFVDTLLRLTATQSNELINIGAGEDYSIREFAEMICDVVGFDRNAIIYDTEKYTGAKAKCLSVEKLQQFVPDYAPRPLAEGIVKTVRWFYETNSFG